MKAFGRSSLRSSLPLSLQAGCGWCQARPGYSSYCSAMSASSASSCLSSSFDWQPAAGTVRRTRVSFFLVVVLAPPSFLSCTVAAVPCLLSFRYAHHPPPCIQIRDCGSCNKVGARDIEAR